MKYENGLYDEWTLFRNPKSSSNGKLFFGLFVHFLSPEFRLCGWIMQIGVVNLLPNELGYDMIEIRYAGTTPLVGFINQCRKAG